MLLSDFLVRIAVAFLLATLIGLERQYKHRLAGIRTNVLVCVGSFLFVSAGILDTVGDRSRIVAQVVSGIGFLAGGVILREGFNVRGLNTAATLWGTAAIGILTSLGFLEYAFIGTLVILVANVLLVSIARKMFSKGLIQQEDGFDYELNISCVSYAAERLRDTLINSSDEMNVVIKSIDSRNVCFEDKVIISATIMTGGKKDIQVEKFSNMISLQEGILSIGWKSLG